MSLRGKVLPLLLAVLFIATPAAFLVLSSSGTAPLPALAKRVPRELMTREPGTRGDSPDVFSGSDPFSIPAGTRGPNGTDPVVVIPVEFSDVTHNSAHDQSYLQTLFNAPTGGSVNAYYRENSYGNYGINAVVTTWVRSVQTMATYGRDSATGVDDATGPIYRLTTEAVQLANAQVNFATYDRDGDGVVDHVVIVHAGGAQESSSNTNLIWSHRWAVIDANPSVPGDQPLTVDGVRVYGYTMVSEDSPLGVIAHEFGHDLGLPDLYDTDGSSHGAGTWEIMAEGSWNGNPRGSSPADFTAWSKSKLGWVTPIDVTAPLLTQPVLQLENHSVAYRLTVRTASGGDEYFLVENRELAGFDAALPGAGLLIWHVDDAMPNNDNDAHRLLGLVEMHGGDTPVDASDPWTSAANPAGWGPGTIPNSNGYGNIPTGWKARNLSPAGWRMTADLSREVDDDLAVVKVNGAFAVRAGAPVDLRVTIRNQGVRTETNVNVTLRVFRGAMNASGELPVPGSTQILSSLARDLYANLSWRFTPASAGRYIVDAKVDLSLDEIPENNERLSHFVAFSAFYFRDDMESGAGNWTTPGQSTNDLNRWEIRSDSDPDGGSHSPAHAWRFGNYSTPIPNPLPPPYHYLEMAAAASIPSNVLYLVYYQRYDLLGKESPSGFNASDTDHGYVEVSVAGGPWQQVAHFSGKNLVWRAVSVNLTSYLPGGATTVAVRFNSTASVLSSIGGWWVDDVMLLPTNFSYAVAVVPVAPRAVIDPGTAAAITFKAVNVGDFDDTFRVVAALPAGWTATVIANATAAIPLDQLRLPLAPDGEATLQLRLQSPADILRGTVVEVPVTLVSQGNGLRRAAFTATVTINDPLGLGTLEKYAVWLVILGIGFVVIIVVVDSLKARKYRGRLR